MNKIKKFNIPIIGRVCYVSNDKDLPKQNWIIDLVLERTDNGYKCLKSGLVKYAEPIPTEEAISIMTIKIFLLEKKFDKVFGEKDGS